MSDNIARAMAAKALNSGGGSGGGSTVTRSTTNGNIRVNNAEMQVYNDSDLQMKVAQNASDIEELQELQAGIKDGEDGKDGFSPIIKQNADNDSDTYKLDITTADGTFTTVNLKGDKGDTGAQGLQGERGEQGTQGIQGIQGIQGEKGNDGYPFLIYKEYETVDEFQAEDFPEIGLMFMVTTIDEEMGGFPVYRYTGDEGTPYSLVTSLSTGEAIKGEKGDKGEKGEQGVAGVDGKDGTTYTPVIGTVETADYSAASVDIEEDTKTAKFNFTLPKGDKGEKGDRGEKGEQGDGGEIPYMKDGTWWYGDTDSGVPVADINDILEYVDGVDGIQDTPVGHILAAMANNPPKHYLKCDGAVYNIGEYPYLEQHITAEFGKVNHFGGNGTTTFAVPDLRELALVGAGQNGKYSIAAHDVYAVGQFRDDQMQTHTHNYLTLTSTVGAGWTVGNLGNVYGTYTSTNNNGRSGTTTHGKQIGILYCIKYEPTYYVNAGESGGVKISTEITDDSTNNTAAGTKAVYDFVKSSVETLPSAQAHNGTFRGKNLTEIYTIEQLHEKVSSGDFSDLYLGDYITVSITTTLPDEVVTEDIDLMIAAFDYYYSVGDTPLTDHHIVLIPRTHFETSAQMNETDTIEKGYLNSYMHQTILPCYAKSLQKSLNNHVLTYRDLLTNEISSTAASMGGVGLTGASSSWEWSDVTLQLMNEVQVYGTTVFSSSAYDVGAANRMLPVFNFINPMHYISVRTSFWLRSVVSNKQFACYRASYASSYNAAGKYRVRPLILFG